MSLLFETPTKARWTGSRELVPMPTDQCRHVHEDLIPETSPWSFGFAQWLTCGLCGANAFCHEYQSYACRPCGHHDGDHYMGRPNTAEILRAWTVGRDLTKWNPIKGKK